MNSLLWSKLNGLRALSGGAVQDCAIAVSEGVSMKADEVDAVKTDIPFRLDRLPWSRFHLLVVLGLGITWILDGLEVTIVGSLGPALESPETLQLSSQKLGWVASLYVIGAVMGALVFGWLTDRFGRRLVFYVTLLIYLAGVLLSAFAWNFWSFGAFRLITGLGIGGEYAAVNSAIDELIPAKYRGRVDLIVNGSFWLGAAFGALAAPFLLDQSLFPVNLGWRLGFGIGGLLGTAILLLRRFVPESPRWLVTHCQTDEAEETVRDIEESVLKSTGKDLESVEGSLTIHPRKAFGLELIFSAMLNRFRERSILALALMIAQSFLYNSVFFTFGLILAHFYHVPSEHIGFYVLPLAIGNFCGPLLLGSLFDTIGRKRMIAGTFALSGLLLIGTAGLFGWGLLSATTQTLAWLVIFFFASAAASSAYLTASEIFPLETRALAIACFYAMGTALGGSVSPALFGWLVQSGSAWYVSFGYVFAAVLLLIAALAEWAYGINAEQKSLESIADPLSK
jgi:MFS family permease